MKLISDWRRAWRFHSAQAHVVQMAIVGTWVSLPGDMRAAVPVKWVLVAVGVAGAAGLVGRLLDQSPKPPNAPDDTDQAGA